LPKKQRKDDAGDDDSGEFPVNVEWPEKVLEQDEDGNKHYESVKLNGVDFKVGDVVALWTDEWKETQKDGPIGEVIALVTDGTENFVELKWFYNVAETSIRGQKRKQHNPRELFLSDHIEEQQLEAIARKVTMKRDKEISNLAEYCAVDGNYYYSRKWDYEEHDFIDF